MVHLIGSTREFDQVIGVNKLTVVDFFAEWCGPCKMIAPFIESLAAKYPNVAFVKVDVDQQQELAQRHGIKAMPTFKFFVAGQMVDEMRGADKTALENKVMEHQNKGATAAFSGSGYTLAGATPTNGAAPVNARDARLQRFGDLAPGTGNGRQIVDAPKATSDGGAKAAEDEDAELAKAIAMSMSSESSPPPADTVFNNSADAKEKSATCDAADTKEAQKMLAEEEGKDFIDGEELVPLPVDESILKELLEMGFTDTRARKGIHYGGTLDGAVAWLSEHENDPGIDEAFMVKKSEAIPKKPLTEEEKAEKMLMLKELAAKRRAEREAAEKAQAIVREKERRERGQKMAETDESRVKMMKDREREKLKREKAEAAAEKKRLLEEIKRDKAIRAANKGVLPSVLGVDGYNPSAVQFDRDVEGMPNDVPATTTAASSGTASTGPPKTGAIVPGAAIADPVKAIDGAISTISRHRTSGDGGNALKLLITFVGNIHKNPTEAKYRSINTEGNAFKSKLAGITGSIQLLRALGFEKTDDGRMKLDGDDRLPLIGETLQKLTQAEASFWAANPK